MSFNNVPVVYVKGYMSKNDAINIMNDSNLIDKSGVLK